MRERNGRKRAQRGTPGSGDPALSSMSLKKHNHGIGRSVCFVLTVSVSMGESITVPLSLYFLFLIKPCNKYAMLRGRKILSGLYLGNENV